MNEKNYDVILVGGGIMGCATAYYLLQADNNLRVAIVEKDPTYARASTTLSDGNIRVQFNLKENIQISQYGLEVLKQFAEVMAVDDDIPDAAFRQQGDLFLFDVAGRQEAEKGVALQNSLGCGIELLQPEEIARRYPLLNIEGIVGGSFGAQEGTMDPYAMLQAFRKKAISLGAAYLPAEVASLAITGKRVNGVKLVSGETLNAPVIVNSAGAWGTELARAVGIDLPIIPVKRQVFAFETTVRPSSNLPFILFPSGLYMIQEHGGHFICGKSFADDPIGYDDFSWDQTLFIDRIWPELVEYVPDFDRLRVNSGWSGLYAVNTFDGNAILGEWPDIAGLYLIGGFSGHGFQQCFGVGRYISELILNCPPILDLSIFSPQRLLDNKPVYEGRQKLI